MSVAHKLSLELHSGEVLFYSIDFLMAPVIITTSVVMITFYVPFGTYSYEISVSVGYSVFHLK